MTLVSPRFPALEVTVVIPARDEAQSIGTLIAEIAEALSGIRHEIVVVDDGSTDDTSGRVAELAGRMPDLRCLRHTASCGQSAAIRTGVHAARGTVVATLDADGQNPPAELPRLVAPFLCAAPDRTLGLVQGQRVGRRDTGWKKAGSRLANAIRGGLLKDGVRDSGCGLKAFPREVYLMLPYFDHIHRFMPAMVQREGLRVQTVDVAHRPRVAGRSKYGNLQRALVGIVDLAGAAWLMRRRRLPRVEAVRPAAAVPLAAAEDTRPPATPGLRTLRAQSPAGKAGGA
ncbi:glycosyltransferase family 2 protein [Futiania mangrovi]|uniref:Glycosyltransferase family 2 protein n=1 Tax=Futiania mangrovi TaxID=2959716 RepID=A0A9J6PBK2_9PROT|nr:glycosyltransferase family 2 protein [Futiania mangrovii]MCP1335112.1 glycosyltransferase family 2 protein [Futiania mangrovii]